MAVTLFLTIAIFVIAAAFIGLGSLFGRESIKGSCGGVAGQENCDVCGKSTGSCEREKAEARV